jgi:hypothetical protein
MSAAFDRRRCLTVLARRLACGGDSLAVETLLSRDCTMAGTHLRGDSLAAKTACNGASLAHCGGKLSLARRLACKEARLQGNVCTEPRQWRNLAVCPHSALSMQLCRDLARRCEHSTAHAGLMRRWTRAPSLPPCFKLHSLLSSTFRHKLPPHWQPATDSNREPLARA